MKSRSMLLTGGLALSMTAMIAGCGATSTSSSSVVSNRPVSGGTIVNALPPQTNLTWYFPLGDAANDTLYDFQLIDAMYMPLFYVDNQYTINYGDSIASRVTYNKAGTVYHVYMNPKWKWSDGQPVTSADVLWTWNIIRAISAPSAPAPWPYEDANQGDIPNGVKSIVANGNYEFTVTLSKPANQQWFIYNGLSQLSPMPEQAWNKYPSNLTEEITYLGKNATNPSFDTVVDGAYKLGQAISSQSWTLIPNAHFSGRRAYDKIVMAYEGSNAAEFAALKTGAVQVGYVDLAEYGARGELKDVDTLWPGYNFGFQFLSLNLNAHAEAGLGPVFSQLYVRQALEEAIDQKTINRDIYYGYAPPQYGPIPSKPATAYLDPTLEKPLYPFNLSAAKALLTSHGWHEVNGVMTKGGQSLAFKLMYSSGSQSTTDEMTLIQNEWASIGVKVTLLPEPFATMVGIITSPADVSKWDAVSGIGWTYGGSYPSGDEIFEPSAELNFYGYNNPKENSLISTTIAPAASEEASLKAFFSYETYTSKELPVLFINNPGTIEAVAKNVHDVTPTTLNPVTGYALYQDWWVGK